MTREHTQAFTVLFAASVSTRQDTAAHHFFVQLSKLSDKSHLPGWKHLGYGLNRCKQSLNGDYSTIVPGIDASCRAEQFVHAFWASKPFKKK